MAKLIYDKLTDRLLPYTDNPELFQEEYIQNQYCKHYKANLVFIDSDTMCRVSIRNILCVSWDTLDKILTHSIDLPIRVNTL